MTKTGGGGGFLARSRSVRMKHFVAAVVIIVSASAMPVEGSSAHFGYEQATLPARGGSSTWRRSFRSRGWDVQNQQPSRRRGNGSSSATLLASSTAAKQQRKRRPGEIIIKHPNEEVNPDELPTLEEMRAQLGPIGKTIAGAVEVGIVTGGSYLSGAFLGYFLGGVMGFPTFFRPSHLTMPPPAGSPDLAPPLPDPEKLRQGLGPETGRRIQNWNSRAMKTCKSWGELSAAFSGFHALTRVVRGGTEDRWNGIVGSACTGAYLSRKGGPRAMAQGAATFAGFTYILDNFVGGGRGRMDPRPEFVDKPLVEDEAEVRGF